MNMLRQWFLKEDGTAAMEAAMIFPVLLTLMLGVFDLGGGILAAQKVITASQISADLIGRHEFVSDADIDEAVEAAGLSMAPYTNAAGVGIDIVSIEFAEDDNIDILWRRTQNMTPNATAVNSTAGLGVEGNGIVAVTVEYTFVPLFVGFLFDEINMREVAFVRGRKSPTIPMN